MVAIIIAKARTLYVYRLRDSATREFAVMFSRIAALLLSCSRSNAVFLVVVGGAFGDEGVDRAAILCKICPLLRASRVFALL